MSTGQNSEQIVSYGRYVIQSEIGRGSMGVVYKARDPEIDRPIALKVLRHDRVGDEDMVRRFFREAKAAGRLSHPNIVVIYDVGQDHGTVFIAMELVQGEGLEKIMKTGPVDPGKALELCRQVALALDYAHKQGIVHRDVKPSNIIITPGDQVKITDFGIARIQDTPSSEQTQIGSILGTPAYMSPEQVRGERVDGRSDIFSLGTILYEMLCGEKPFKGSNIVEIFQAIASREPSPPSIPNRELPRELKEVVLKALAKDPSERFQTGAEFAQALERCFRLVTGPEAHKGSRGVSDEALSRPVPARGEKGFPIPAVIVGIVILVAIAVLVIWRPWAHREGPGTVPTAGAPKQEEIARGNLSVVSNPPGAQVVVDGEARGMTPLTLALEPGAHEVTLKKEGYFPWEAEIRIKPGGVVPLEVEMVGENDL